MIYETSYKDRFAIAVESNNLTAVFLPTDGGKMASLKTNEGKELLEQAKGENYRPLTVDGSYIDAECSAFDDMFPSIDPCEFEGYKYIDHGEVCRIEHAYDIVGDKLVLSGFAKTVNARFTKEISPLEDGIKIKYIIENLNDKPLPFIWAGHMMFAAKEGAEVFTNAPENFKIRGMFGVLPQEPHKIGEYSPFGESYKYYIEDAFSPLVCGIDYKNGEKITVSFEEEAVKYLGVWMNNGSFKGMYNIALEPCTAPFDSPENAYNENVGSVIESKEKIVFTMKIKYTK